MSKIIFENVRKEFGSGLQVLNGIQLDIAKGESHIILGQSGCGKSVLLKCLLGIMPLDSGDIDVDGISIKEKKRFSEYLRKFSILFQGNALFDSMTIIENVMFGARLVAKDKERCRRSAEEKLFAVGLEQRVFDLYPAELSGGMQKRAALARAIAIEPEILLFDEPTSGLDPITGGIICNLLKDTVRSLGVTALTITHDLKVAEFLADRVSVLNNGKVVWTGKTHEMEICGNEFVVEFHRASNVILKKSHRII
ncbi:MAG: ATP-binding cassette domain-containing protein [Holosporaceae bacterium]|jgi:phospholipid/cholesterol/gamma-HCH transport system ATP-binding protein|nr:ATP-binding cassette domain-containing protein [Holosporaceae bacterium]